MLEHLVHMSQLQYKRFHSEYGETLLKYEGLTPGCRQSILKTKTLGLIMHDRVLLQDSRLPDNLKLEY